MRPRRSAGVQITAGGVTSWGTIQLVEIEVRDISFHLHCNHCNIRTSGECIELTSLCDGHPDCSNGEDEDPIHCIALSPEDDIHQNALLIPDRVNFGYLKVQFINGFFSYFLMKKHRQY